MIEYSSDYKRAYYNGEKYCKIGKYGYYYKMNNKKMIGLHQQVYIDNYGEIPKGCVIHHKDTNRYNNDISNLECLTYEEHKNIHNKLRTKEQKEWLINNLRKNALPKAIEWHKSKEGRKWHKEHAEKYKELFHKEKEFVCKECGKHFITTNNKGYFCSANCRSKDRRKRGVDNIKCKCEVCGKEFEKNKYYKTTTCSYKCGNILAYRHRRINEEDKSRRFSISKKGKC